MFDLLLRGLAAYRIAHMLVREAGPFNVFGKLRTATGIEYDDEGNLSVWNPANPLACLWCTSVWTAGMASFLPCAVVKIFAVSAVAVLIDKHSV